MLIMSILVLRLWHMFSLGMEASNRISSVVDNLELALLVIVAISSMQHSIGVPLLISELSVVPAMIGNNIHHDNTHDSTHPTPVSYPNL